MQYLSEVVEGAPVTIQRYVRGIAKNKLCGKGEFCLCSICKAINMGVSAYCYQFGTGGSLSVLDVRRAIAFLSKKVVKYRAVLFGAYSGLSEKSANSLLKILEEPPNNTQLFIGVKSQWVLPVTVLSRCSIKELEFTVAGDSYQAIIGRNLEFQLGLLRQWSKSKELTSRVYDIVHALWQQNKYTEAYQLAGSMLMVEQGRGVVEVLSVLRSLRW